MSFVLYPGFSPSAGLREFKGPLPPLLAKVGYSIIPFQRTFLLGPRSVALSLFVMGILYPLGRVPSSDWGNALTFPLATVPCVSWLSFSAWPQPFFPASSSPYFFLCPQCRPQQTPSSHLASWQVLLFPSYLSTFLLFEHSPQEMAYFTLNVSLTPFTMICSPELWGRQWTLNQ